MEQIMHFVINHWALWLALVVILVLLYLEETKRSVRGMTKLAPQDAVAKINHEHAVIIDVRSAQDFQNGHIVAAINIEANELEANVKKFTKYKSKPVIIVAASEQAAIAAGLKLRGAIENLHFLGGGIGSWSRANLPLTKE